jgi:HD-GYP domain-containing protein (c-di-GMP phosphodiesterase class II)
VFSDFAYDASCHHERIDGRGYYRGIGGSELSRDARILAASDVFEALSAARPYRGALPLEQVLSMLREGVGSQLCGDCVAALHAFCERGAVEAGV